MSDTTQLLLKKYYGFGADSNGGKFLSSHEATYDPCKFSTKPDSPEATGSGVLEEATAGGTGSEAAQDPVVNPNSGPKTGNGILHSSRAILDLDASGDEESDLYEYEGLLQSRLPDETDNSGGNKLSHCQNPSAPEREKSYRVEECVDPSDSVLPSNFEDASEHASDISFVQTTKRSKRKNQLTNCARTSFPTAEAPRKLPSCNGIFLDLTKLNLTEFPIDIVIDVPNLRMLYLENNSLTNLPDQLFPRLRLLQWLDVRNNRLKSLPKNIKGHRCLETILLDGNLIEELPFELCLVPNLKELQASRNPLVFPPADILVLGFAATINFLRIEWNKNHPEESVECPDREKKSSPSTILCSDPPVLRTLSKTSRIFGSSSTGHVNVETKKISVRQKSRNYKPSNKCEKRGTDEELEMRLLWMDKVKEMLNERTIALQKIKDRDALSDWRRDRSSYVKSMSRAARRTEEDIPFAIDLDDGSLHKKNRPKIPLGRSKSRKRVPAWTTNINKKMTELCESLSRSERARKSESLTPRSEQKLLENEIKKLSDVHEDIQNLRRYNEATTAPFDGSKFLPETRQYEPPPSIII